MKSIICKTGELLIVFFAFISISIFVQSSSNILYQDNLDIISDLSFSEHQSQLDTVLILNNDDGAPNYFEEGIWNSSNGVAQCEGISNSTSRYVIVSNGPGQRAHFVPDIPFPGLYEIFFVGPLTGHGNNVLYIIKPFRFPPDSVRIDQVSNNACEWKSVGSYYFDPGRTNEVIIDNDGNAIGYVIRADLMIFKYLGDTPILNVSTDSVDFFEIPVNSSADTTIFIKNRGWQDLIIYNISNRLPQLSLSDIQFPLTIPFDSTAIFTLRFIPDYIGEFIDTLRITSNDSLHSNYPIHVKGKGIGYQLIIDNSDSLSSFTTGPSDSVWSWINLPGFINDNAISTKVEKNPDAWAKWDIEVSESVPSGFELWISTIGASNSPTNVPYLVFESTASGCDTILIDQTSSSNGLKWIRLQKPGKEYFNFFPGSPGYVKVLNDTNYTFQNLPPNSFLWVDALKLNQAPNFSGITSEDILMYKSFNLVLEQNYPNPFNPQSVINYYLPKNQYVRLDVYNINGQIVETLVNGWQTSGKQQIIWNAQHLSSGIYFYRLKTGKINQTKKCIILH